MSKQSIWYILLFFQPLFFGYTQAMERLQMAVHLNDQEEHILRAIISHNYNDFSNEMNVLTDVFKQDLKKITQKYDPRAEFIEYAAYFNFGAVIGFYKDQILHKAIDAAHNAESSIGYGTFRASWNISKEGARELEKCCRLWLKKIEFFSAQAQNHARLWIALRFVHLYILPVLIAIIAVLVIIKPPLPTSRAIWDEKLTSIDAFPFYACTLLYLSWGFYKLIRLKNFCGTHNQQIVQIAWMLTASKKALQELIDTLNHFEPKDRNSVQ